MNWQLTCPFLAQCQLLLRAGYKAGCQDEPYCEVDSAYRLVTLLNSTTIKVFMAWMAKLLSSSCNAGLAAVGTWRQNRAAAAAGQQVA